MTALADRMRTASGHGPGSARAVLGLLLLVAACWGALLGTAPGSAGDPLLVAVSPAAGEVVRSPDEVRLTFDRPVPAGLATVRLTTPSGEQVVTGRPGNPPGAPDTLAVSMPKTRYAGTYSVAWSVPAGTLEPISGTSTFSVFAPTAAPEPPVIPTERDPVVAAVHTAARVAATTAATLGVGMIFVLAVAWPAGVRHEPARRLIRSIWWTLVAATLATVVTFGGYVARTPLEEAFDPALLSAALASDVGAGLLARLVVLVPVTIGLLLLMAAPPADTTVRRWSVAGAVLAGAAALMATWSVARPTEPAGPALLDVGVEVAVMLAVAVCVGGPVVLWMLLRGAGDAVLRTAVPRLAHVMPVAGAMVVVLAVTTASGWQVAALLVPAVLAVGAALAGVGWERRRARTRGKDLAGRVLPRRVAAVAACAAAVALVVIAAAASASVQSQLALSDWSAAAGPALVVR